MVIVRGHGGPGQFLHGLMDEEMAPLALVDRTQRSPASGTRDHPRLTHLALNLDENLTEGLRRVKRGGQVMPGHADHARVRVTTATPGPDRLIENQRLLAKPFGDPAISGTCAAGIQLQPARDDARTGRVVDPG